MKQFICNCSMLNLCSRVERVKWSAQNPLIACIRVSPSRAGEPGGSACSYAVVPQTSLLASWSGAASANLGPPADPHQTQPIQDPVTPVGPLEAVVRPAAGSGQPALLGGAALAPEGVRGPVPRTHCGATQGRHCPLAARWEVVPRTRATTSVALRRRCLFSPRPNVTCPRAMMNWPPWRSP